LFISDITKMDPIDGLSEL